MTCLYWVDYCWKSSTSTSEDVPSLRCRSLVFHPPKRGVMTDVWEWRCWKICLRKDDFACDNSLYWLRRWRWSDQWRTCKRENDRECWVVVVPVEVNIPIRNPGAIHNLITQSRDLFSDLDLPDVRSHFPILRLVNRSFK